MSQGMENAIRRSLDAVDAYRRRLTGLLVIAGVAVAWEFYRLAQIAKTGDVPHLIVAAVLVLFFSMLAVAVVIVFQVTVASRRILRAIELASLPAGAAR